MAAWLGARAAVARAALTDVLRLIEAARHGRGRSRAVWATVEATGQPVGVRISHGEAMVLVRALGPRCDRAGPGAAELVAAVSVLLDAASAADRLAAARVVRIAADLELRRAEAGAREPYRSPWKRRRAAERARRRELVAGLPAAHGSGGLRGPGAA